MNPCPVDYETLPENTESSFIENIFVSIDSIWIFNSWKIADKSLHVCKVHETQHAESQCQYPLWGKHFHLESSSWKHFSAQLVVPERERCFNASW